MNGHTSKMIRRVARELVARTATPDSPRFVRRTARFLREMWNASPRPERNEGAFRALIKKAIS